MLGREQKKVGAAFASSSDLFFLRPSPVPRDEFPGVPKKVEKDRGGKVVLFGWDLLLTQLLQCNRAIQWPSTIPASHDAFILCVDCALTVRWLCVDCVLTVCWQCVDCVLTVCWLCVDCVLSVCWQCVVCALTLCWLCVDSTVCWFDCVLIVYWLWRRAQVCGGGPVNKFCTQCGSPSWMSEGILSVSLLHNIGLSCRALLQKRPILWRSLLIIANMYMFSERGGTGSLLKGQMSLE